MHTKACRQKFYTALQGGYEFCPKATSSSATSGTEENDVVLKTKEEEELDFFEQLDLTDPEVEAKLQSEEAAKFKAKRYAKKAAKSDKLTAAEAAVSNAEGSKASKTGIIKIA